MKLRDRIGHVVRTIIATAGAAQGTRVQNVTAMLCPKCRAITVNPIRKHCTMCGAVEGFETYDLPSGTAIWTGDSGIVRARAMSSELLINNTKKRGS
jgi:aminopeptidase-like protein